MRLKGAMYFVSVLLLLSKPTLPETHQSSDARSKMVGVWTSATLEQIGAAQRPECTFITISERTVTLKSLAGTDQFEGEWVRWTRNVWLRSDNLRCRWYPGEEQFEPVLGAVWTYNLKDITPNGRRDSVTVQGTYVNCLANGCDKMKVRDKVFRTQLVLIGGSLVDTNETDDPTDDVKFLRLSDAAELVDDARSAVEILLKPLDRGEIDQFYSTATSSTFRSNTPLDQFHSVTADMQAKSGLVNSRRYLQTTNILYAPMIAKSPARICSVLKYRREQPKRRGGRIHHSYSRTIRLESGLD